MSDWKKSKSPKGLNFRNNLSVPGPGKYECSNILLKRPPSTMFFNSV